MGIRKKTMEVLTFKKKPLEKGPLLQLNKLEVESALSHFTKLVNLTQ